MLRKGVTDAGRRAQVSAAANVRYCEALAAASSDRALGQATQTSPGVWTFTANTPANTPAGTYKLFAQAKDSNGTLSAPIATTVTVQ